MSKSLKKLIDINRLREFKSKLVGAGSAYVQTGAVDQTIAGTKTFSKPIAGSVTGNAATATKATQDANGNVIATTYATKAENNTKANDSEVVHKNGDTLGDAAIFTFPDSGSSLDAPASAFPLNRGGLHWTGQSDWVTLQAVETASDCLDLQAQFGDSPTNNNGVNGFGIVDCLGNVNARIDCLGNATFKSISADTGTFSKPIVGSVTGSSGSCTGNAASATKATQDAAGNTITTTYATKAENNIKANDSEVVHKSGDESIAGTKTFSSNIVGNVTGTATKLATARTIALSGAATGTATAFDGSGNITIPVTALASSAIRAQWYAAYPDGAEAHNAMWGGRDITAAFDAGTVSANIANGTFYDIFPGDYITKQVTISGTAYTVNWVVADCDYWINKGDDPVITTHHVVIVPQQPIFNYPMNGTNNTVGGYADSRMYTSTIPACATGIVNAFGASHILTFRDSITKEVNASSISSGAPFWTGASSDWGWYDAQCNLMCERMVYGMPAFSSSAWDAGVATRQFSAFRLSERLINYNRQNWWLRDVVSSAAFAHVYGAGSAAADAASASNGVRPFALLV